MGTKPYGLALASRWEEQLKEWDQLLPPEEPASVEKIPDMVRLYQWMDDIVSAVDVYKNMATDREMIDTLEVMRGVERKAIRKVRRLIETIEMTAEARRVAGSLDLEEALNRLETA
jgi:hypothetical protein